MSDVGSDDEGPVVSLTSFLFGNVDTKTGKLEDGSIFGTDSDKQIKALENLGLGFQTVLSDDDVGSDVTDENKESSEKRKRKVKKQRFSYDSSDGDSDESEDDEDEVDKENSTRGHKSSVKVSKISDDYDEDVKSPTAVDFSDITEYIEEETGFNGEEFKPFGARDDDDDDYDAVDPDMWKMPPPPPPPPFHATVPKVQVQQSSSLVEKKLDTPLASMLPSKYAGVSVTTLFPDFRADKVLRFSRLFGPGKYNSLPQIWKNVKMRRRRRKEKLQEEQNALAGTNSSLPGLGDSSTSTLPEISSAQFMVPTLGDIVAERRRQRVEWERHYGEDEVPDSSQCVPDEEEIFCRAYDATKEGTENYKKDEHGQSKTTEKKNLWRHGPAAIWFEMLGVPDNPDHFEYGFRKKAEKETNSEEESSDEEKKTKINSTLVFPDDCFNMVTQSDWEEEIIWDSQDAKTKKLAKNKTGGWVPSVSNRFVQNVPKTPGAMLTPGTLPLKMTTSTSSFSSSTTTPAKGIKSSKTTDKPPVQADDTWYSIFPVETTELVNGHWEKDIIWDVDNVDVLPEPKVLELDPNDENIILCIPDDVDPNATQNTTAPVKVKIPHPHVKKSKILLGKAGVINVIEEDSPPPSPKDDGKDPYNLSLDEYYQAKHTEQALIKISTSGNIIQHSTPVVELRAPFIPTHMNLMKLRNFHRPALRKLNNGTTASPGPHGLLPLTKHIEKKAKQRDAERLAAGGGDIFFMRISEDFSGKDGELVLLEYCEEHPPLLNQVGMCSKIKNYYKRMAGKNDAPEDRKYGETVSAHTSPFLGAMHPGQIIQTVENNMYRSAIFPHNVRATDFLIIRTRNNFLVRTFDAIFTAAQECPLYEVPGPNSKRANNFVRDFLQVFIYRLFWSSRDVPRRIRMDDIKRAFPMHSESSIRKRLKLCADFKRTGVDSNWWVIKPEFRLPTEEEIRAMVSPEQCCAYFSLAAAEQRLKDAGYGTQSILAPLPEDEDENEEKKQDDEVKVAPWNTTRAYIQAIKGKCILQINGPADPTGCGEGFSYVRMPNKPQTTVEEKETQPKRIVTGTDADLRRLSLNNAKALLRKFGVPEDEIQKLSRWEVIDVVRTLSTEKAKAGKEGMNKFSRGNRFSVAEHQERYKEECQRIFELQNRVLHSSEVLSTDEGESSEEEEDTKEDFEEMGKNIENMLTNAKTTSQLRHEREEQERLELQKMILGEGKDDKDEDKQGKKKKVTEEDNSNLNGLTLHPGRVLKIQRKYKNSDGKVFIRDEIVRKSNIIDIYVRIRTTKDEAWIRQFTLNDDQVKEEMKKEKRRIQEQLRRIKRNQDKPNRTMKARPLFPKKMKKVKLKPELKVKCGACGQVGHMKTNKACPYYDKSKDPLPSVNVAMTEEEEGEMGKRLLDELDIGSVKIEGTKMALSSKLWKQTDEIKRRSLVLKVPKEFASLKGRRKRSMNAESLDYLEGKAKGTNRRRIDPQVLLTNIFETILNDLRDEPDSSHFHFPVSAKFPKYYDVIQTPMDLQTMRTKNRDRIYQTGADFLADVKLMRENSIQYNGPVHIVTAFAKKMVEIAESKLSKQSQMVPILEKQINPLLDENDKHRLSYILKTILDKVKLVPQAGAFLKPVNKKLVKDYYDIVPNPMDLETIERKLNDGNYFSRYDFLTDLTYLQTNSEKFNGPEHIVTQNAKYVLDFVKGLLEDLDEPLLVLEANIQRNIHDDEYDEEYSMGADELFGRNFPDGEGDVIEESVVTMDEFQMIDDGEFMMDSKKRVRRRESGELSSSSDDERPGPSKKFRHT